MKTGKHRKQRLASTPTGTQSVSRFNRKRELRMAGQASVMMNTLAAALAPAPRKGILSRIAGFVAKLFA